jgi:hypothetical protein
MASMMSPWPNHHTSGDGISGYAHVVRQIRTQLAHLANSAQSEPGHLVVWESSTASVTRASREQIDLIERMYILQGREAIRSYLECHPHLISLLLEAWSMIPLYFSGMPIILRLVEDPEGYQPPQIGVYILVPNDNPDAALARLTAFDQEWWLDAMDRAFGDLFMTITAA